MAVFLSAEPDLLAFAAVMLLMLTLIKFPPEHAAAPTCTAPCGRSECKRPTRRYSNQLSIAHMHRLQQRIGPARCEAWGLMADFVTYADGGAALQSRRRDGTVPI